MSSNLLTNGYIIDVTQYGFIIVIASLVLSAFDGWMDGWMEGFYILYFRPSEGLLNILTLQFHDVR